MSYDVEVIRSKRKTMSLEITRDLRIVVRAPLRMKESEIRRFVLDKSDWIDKHMEKMKERQNDEVLYLSEQDILELTREAKKRIPPRVAYYAELMGLRYGRISIRHQKTRWGSCSSQSNLNFNCMLMLCPVEIMDYVIVHELCHLIEMNHSPRFWAEVEKILPDYKQRRRWLKDKGSRFIQ